MTKERKEIKLAICVPLSWPNVPSAFFVSYTSLFMPSRLEAMAKAGVKNLWHLVDKSFPLDYCRNRLARIALEKGATHVLFIDADMTFPRDLIVRLLSIDADVAGALYFKKTPPFQPVASRLGVKGDGQLMKPIRLPARPGIVRCDVVGMGATLIKREALEFIGHPWFAYDLYKPTGEMEITEDVTFCTKAKSAGFEIVCDTRLVCGHVRSDIVGARHWAACRGKFERPAKCKQRNC